MFARIADIFTYLPSGVLTNQDLESQFPGWSARDVENKVGIVERRIAADDECASDLAVKAAEKIFSDGGWKREDVDFLVFCTQSPDYLLPTTSCLIQDRLGLSRGVGAFDFNLGCSGYVYGLGIAKGLIETGQARGVLLLTGDTYSKFLRNDDKGLRSIFGDGGSATFVTIGAEPCESIGPFVYGSDGSGGHHLIVQNSAMRRSDSPVAEGGAEGLGRSRCDMYMNGPAVFSFTLKVVSEAVSELLSRCGLSVSDIDCFVFHQANRYMLEHLRDKLGISSERFAICMEKCGNTVSSSIPIALAELKGRGSIAPGSRLMLVGFGVGLSWAATIVRL